MLQEFFCVYRLGNPVAAQIRASARRWRGTAWRAFTAADGDRFSRTNPLGSYR
jgi:hypothetical protein